jgi:hypothetical protein
MSQNFVGSVFGRLHGPPVVPFQERLKLLDVLVIVRYLTPLLREIQKFGLGPRIVFSGRKPFRFCRAVQRPLNVIGK